MLLALPALRLAAQNTSTFSTEVRVVSVFATVRNKQGQLVNDLTQDDFLLTEDGRPQAIRYFSRETDLPLTLGLLVDTSGSMASVIGEERGASHVFLHDMVRPEKDQAFILHFDREAELLQDLTNSREKLEKACDLLAIAAPGGGPGGYPGRRHGGTVLYDALYLSSSELMSKEKGRKAAILLSDGKDNASKTPMSQAIESAQRADTMVYSILFENEPDYPIRPGGFGRRRGGLGGPMPRYPQASGPDGKKVLQQLAKETGGDFFEASKKLSIDKIYSRIQEELRNQYSLGYTSDQPNGGGYRKISVTTKSKSLMVQARDGYYVDPH
ncbi:MAG: VWA domain-containing protein [Acidobacteriia bacterium]|nr:VWA domain-containing protein [Terriglobia bacterium]